MGMDEQNSENLLDERLPDSYVPMHPKKRKSGEHRTKPGIKVPTITYQEVFDMAAYGCTLEEIAYNLKVNPSTIDRNFGEAHRAGHASLCYQLRKKQVELAIKGNVTMLIFLGKTYLSQFDTQRIETKIEQVTKFETAEELKNKLEELIASKMVRYNRQVA